LDHLAEFGVLQQDIRAHGGALVPERALLHEADIFNEIRYRP
jgi:hypothetical protein